MGGRMLGCMASITPRVSDEIPLASGCFLYDSGDVQEECVRLSRHLP